jgi:acyl-coenzyme A synthetase/AMP-(fatty) acid ligase
MQLVSKAIEWYAENCRDRIALSCSSGDVTYRDMNALCNIWARHFIDSGVSATDRVLILMDNDIEFVVAVIAIARIGASLVFVNTGLTPVEIGRICKEVHTSVVITERKYGQQQGSSIENANMLFYKENINQTLRDATNRIDYYQSPILIPETVQSEVIFFTSGSTGKPKGMVFNKSKFEINISSHSTDSGTYLIARPLFFRAHFSSLCFMLQEGKKIVLPTLFEPAGVYELMDRNQPRQMITSPFDLLALFKWMKMEGKALPISIKELVSTGSALTNHMREELYRMAPTIQLIDLYGLSEVGVVSMIDNQQWNRNKGSVGKPAFFVKVRILDKSGEELPTGEPGEISVSSRYMMDQYYNAELLNKQMFCKGYIRTGDIGYIDSAGYLYILGRNDHSINRAGYMFHLSEIENLLRCYSGVEQAVVVRTNDEYGLQVPVAFIQPLHTGGLSSEDYLEGLKGYCMANLSSFKVPEKFFTLDQIPYNEAGKVDIIRLQKVIWRGDEIS